MWNRDLYSCKPYPNDPAADAVDSTYPFYIALYPISIMDFENNRFGRDKYICLCSTEHYLASCPRKQAAVHTKDLMYKVFCERNNLAFVHILQLFSLACEQEDLHRQVNAVENCIQNFRSEGLVIPSFFKALWNFMQQLEKVSKIKDSSAPVINNVISVETSNFPYSLIPAFTFVRNANGDMLDLTTETSSCLDCNSNAKLLHIFLYIIRKELLNFHHFEGGINYEDAFYADDECVAVINSHMCKL
jgi:hypothetical protein